ncbi:hypothetical protein [Flavobacterium psychrotrophum]|uniref:hypothetical protein n=1 Tax=Flavobacterium psychrotrophum TaxID=2294119 RepID=UPI000E3190DD|nr:hypothetical protein [Flavobacterium psychrotrophum]
MDTTKIKLKMLRRIMDADETQLEQKVHEAFTEFCSDCNTSPNSVCAKNEIPNPVLAYSRDGQPLTATTLKEELLSITEDANKGLPVQHRLNSIFWL